MRSIWKGTISFGLVSIPIKLYSVARQESIGFRMLCGTCNTPIIMRRWCPHCKKEVVWENVVKGLEVHKGDYFAITQETIKELRPTTTNAIVISSFVDKELIDPVYRNTCYYAAPADTHRAYTLFARALEVTSKVAIGTFVMRDREHVSMIQPYENGLLLTTLHYAYEVRPIAQVEELRKADHAVEASELKLAKQLIEQRMHKTLDMTKFKDTFAQEIKKLVKQKAEGKKIKKLKVVHKKKKATTSLMDTLKASLSKEARS